MNKTHKGRAYVIAENQEMLRQAEEKLEQTRRKLGLTHVEFARMRISLVERTEEIGNRLVAY